MTTRQYIGARYVPKYFENPDGSNTWIEGVEYDALTIVNYAGTNYISKKPVPHNIGTPNVNGEYWIVSDSGGGAIDNIQKDVTNLKNDVSSIETEIEPLLSKKYILMADSYGTYYNDNNLNYLQQACENAGIDRNDYYDFVQGGASFSNTDAQYNFRSVLERNATQISNKNEITDIFVFGGVNEWKSTKDEIWNGIASFSQYVKNTFPNAKIYIGCISKAMVQSLYGYNTKFIEAYSKCSKYGCTYLDNSEWIMQRWSLFENDRVHPLSTSVNYLANYVSQLLLNHSVDVVFSVEPVVSATTGYTLDATRLKAFFKNGVVQYTGNNLAILDIKFSNKTTSINNAISNFMITNETFFNNDEGNINKCLFGTGILLKDNIQVENMSYVIYQNVANNIVYWSVIFTCKAGIEYNEVKMYNPALFSCF